MAQLNKRVLVGRWLDSLPNMQSMDPSSELAQPLPDIPPTSKDRREVQKILSTMTTDDRERACQLLSGRSLESLPLQTLLLITGHLHHQSKTRLLANNPRVDESTIDWTRLLKQSSENWSCVCKLETQLLQAIQRNPDYEEWRASEKRG